MAPTNPDHHRVDPTGGIVPWLGGKRNLALRLVARIEAIPHVCYAEPFVGAGGVFLRRRRRPRVEAINDRSRDLATLFRVLQRHPDALIGQISALVAARWEFDLQRRQDPDLLTDIERAARLVYLQCCCFGGRPASHTFGVSPLARARFNAPRIAQLLRRIHTRLAAVYIDCDDFEAFIRRWDRPGTLFYIDPPYHGCERDYGSGLFERGDFERLAEVLRGLSGRFLLSLNDVPEVHRSFAGAPFRIERIETTWQLNCAQRITELLITDNR